MTSARVLALLLASTSTDVPGACQWQWICDGSGQCEHVPLCDSTLSLPPPEPPAIAPIAPLSIRPIQPPTIPPIGTSQCQPFQVKNASGKWSWETVCR
ncbi:hypothetical protein ACW73L_04735 [Methylolobus aquaticus]